MELIKQIEIGYFRSIYKNTLSEIKGTNIIFGRNDAGKSNVLRALNLFFNNETNPGLGFDFERDLCHARQAEADSARYIKKFVYVKLWFNTPPSYRASLGPEFWVKKQWSITRESEPIFDSSISEARLQQYLTRLLNKIHFYYVPAIKDRRIFEQLLGKIYTSISSHEAFKESLGDFSTALRDRTTDLTEGLTAALGVTSIISPPSDLTDLFQSLDFETDTDNTGDACSLTLQRGDGIQVRHIPAILAFLSDRSPEDFHIWGFEEPENSLELANAIGEAALFCNYGEATNKQVFLTSHSPAFFALERPTVARFFVSRTEKHSERLTSKLHPISDQDDESPSDLMGETPHLPIISSYLKEADARIRQLRTQGDQLMDELQRRKRSVVFVEGESDKIILCAAWDILVGDRRPFDVEAAEGTTKMESLGKDGKIIDCLAPNRKVLVVVDNDTEGRDLYRTKHLIPGGKWVTHNSNHTHWCRLPFTDDFRALMTKIGIQDVHWPGSLENLFSTDIRQRAAEAGVGMPSNSPHAELLDPANYPKIAPFLAGPERFYILSTEPESKIPFADWIAKRAKKEPEILEPLRPVVEGMRRILADSGTT